VTFISFAQRQEDVVLKRLFAKLESGTFIDVGANDPIIESVSYWAHKLGWRGVNIEPNPRLFDRIVVERPNDYNFNVAIGDRLGVVEFSLFDPPLHGRSGVGVQGINSVAPRVERVQMLSLEYVIELTGVDSFDFLSVDVEGFELEVLRSANWETFRPKLVLVEVLHPVTSLPNLGVRQFLEGFGYVLALHDGLNDYYLEKEFYKEYGHLTYLPTIQDEYETAHQHFVKLTKNG
jgi:FkbM family methyltransferase